jgi:hypothetical protein
MEPVNEEAPYQHPKSKLSSKIKPAQQPKNTTKKSKKT